MILISLYLCRQNRQGKYCNSIFAITGARLSISAVIQHRFMRQGIVLFSRFQGFAITDAMVAMLSTNMNSCIPFSIFLNFLVCMFVYVF